MIRKQTWITLVLFAVCLFAILYFDRRNPTEVSVEPSPTAISVAVPAAALENLNTIVYHHQGAVLIELKLDTSGKWILASKPETGVNPARVEEIAANLSSLKVHSVLPAGLDPADLGLSPADQEVDLINFKGKNVRLLIGNQTPTGSGYYFQTGNAAPVIVGKGAWETIAGLLTPESLLQQDASSP